jgi:putative holliday junction resolvase
VRVLGVDLGARRIGLAISDPGRVLATPLDVLERAADHEADHAAIVDRAHREGATHIVVGLPRSLSGADGPAAQAARAEAEELRGIAGPDLPVTLHDERLTTVSATRRLREARGRDSRRRGRRREPVDAAAAAEILQSYLDAMGVTASRSDQGRRARRSP